MKMDKWTHEWLTEIVHQQEELYNYLVELDERMKEIEKKIGLKRKEEPSEPKGEA